VPATHFVASASLASLDFALFLARYDSFAPVNADSPEFFPDCSTIIHIRTKLSKRCIHTNIVFTISIGITPCVSLQIVYVFSQTITLA